MAKIRRSLPRRPAWLYPVGTTLTFRNGRVFEVVTERISVVGFFGDIEWQDSQRFWREVLPYGDGLVMTEEQFNAFQQILDLRPKDMKKFRKLMSMPSVFLTED